MSQTTFNNLDKLPVSSSLWFGLYFQELIKKIIDLENDVKDKDRQLSLQERYIDELLLKVIMVAPGLLDQGFQPKPSIKARSPVQRYQAKKQEVIIWALL